MKKAIDKQAFLKANDLPLTWVPLPEDKYGKDAGVYVRNMTGAERSALEDRFASDKRMPVGAFRKAVLLSTVVDEEGKPLFADKDGEAVMAKNAGVLETMFERSCEINGLTQKDVDNIEGNSQSSR